MANHTDESPSQPEENAVAEKAPTLKDQWTWDKRAELEKAHLENHYSKESVAETWLTGDETKQGRDYHVARCGNLLALCELYDLRVEGLGVHGIVPVVFVDVRPSVPRGYPKKFGEISEFPPDYIRKGKDAKETRIISDFDLSVWGAACHQKDNGDYEVDSVQAVIKSQKNVFSRFIGCIVNRKTGRFLNIILT